MNYCWKWRDSLIAGPSQTEFKVEWKKFDPEIQKLLTKALVNKLNLVSSYFKTMT